MAIDERDRHRLYAKLEEVLGAEEARTLIAHLPPVGWADVATKRDLDTAADSLRLELRAFQEANRLDHEVLRKFLEASEHRVLAALLSATDQRRPHVARGFRHA